MASVFLSHNSKDKAFVRRLANRLSQSGVTVWLDEAELKIGDSLIGRISEAIEQVEYVVAVISSNSVNSRWVKKEIKLALAKEMDAAKPLVLPVLLDDCNIPGGLADRVYGDFRKPDDFEGPCEALLAAIAGAESDRYLGRIERAKSIAAALEDTSKEYGRSRRHIEIRMRATFTSMSNIAHYRAEELLGLSRQQAKELNQMLVRERQAMLRLLSKRRVRLQCICWPKGRFLSDKYYTDPEKRRRFRLLEKFLTSSLENHLDRRRILCDKAGAYGNQLLIGNRIALVANPESGGYTKTSVFEDQQAVDVLNREYDHLFQRIWKNKRIPAGVSLEKGRARALLEQALRVLEREVPTNRS